MSWVRQYGPTHPCQERPGCLGFSVRYRDSLSYALISFNGSEEHRGSQD